MNKIVFLEGPAFSGKTTFLRQTPPEVIRLPEASEFLGGDTNFPDAPVDAESMAHCSYFFASMENKRFESIGENDDAIVVADRFTPLSSMVFYSLRHANGDIDNVKYQEGMRLSAAIFNRVVQLPAGQSKFIRFTVSSPEVLSERLPRGTRNEELATWQAFQFYNAQYDSLLPSSTEVVVDGDYSSDLLDGTWEEAKTLLPTTISSKTHGIETVTDEEIERYLPSKTRQAIQSRVKQLIHEGNA